MADILIRGMEIPTQDALLHIHADGRAVLYPFCVLDKVTECEAIELPPHGDLIDRDAVLSEDILQYVDTLRKAFGESYVDVLSVFKNAPVVIPADKEAGE